MSSAQVGDEFDSRTQLMDLEEQQGCLCLSSAWLFLQSREKGTVTVGSALQ